jgi:hypothetical protein
MIRLAVISALLADGDAPHGLPPRHEGRGFRPWSSVNVFERALAIIEEDGWHQGAMRGPDGSACLMAERWHYRLPAGEGRRWGALSAWRARGAAEEALLRAACEEVSGPFCGGVHMWNDQPGRSEEDVRLALKMAARNLGEQEGRAAR